MSNKYVIDYELMQDIMKLPRDTLEIHPGAPLAFGDTPEIIGSALSTAQSNGYREGAEQLYRALWGALQELGNRTNYDYCFYNWPDGICYPEYHMGISSAKNMFRGCKASNLRESLRDRLHTNNCKDFYYMFCEAKTSALPQIIIPYGVNLKVFDGAFSWCSNLVSAEIVFNEGEGTYPSSMFNGSSKLKDIDVSGIIANGGLSFYSQQSLSKQTIIDIIHILADYTSGLSITFSRNAVNKAFETASNKWNGTSSTEWLNLVNSKPNWTIALA